VLLQGVDRKFFRCRNINNVIVSILEVNGVKSVDPSVIRQMFTVETYDMSDAVYRGNGHMAAIVVNP
jgi:hypothetical protein